MDSNKIPLSEAKASFFDLVARVEAKGGEVVLMRRGRPVAKIVPIGTPEAESGVSSFGFLKGKLSYDSTDSLGTSEEDWGELSDDLEET